MNPISTDPHVRGEPFFFFIIKLYLKKENCFPKRLSRRALFFSKEHHFSSHGEPFHLIRKGWKWCWLSFKRGLFWLSWGTRLKFGAIFERRAIFFLSRNGPLLTQRAKSDLFFLWNGSPIKGGTKMELHRELSYVRSNGSPRRGIWLSFFSVCVRKLWGNHGWSAKPSLANFLFSSILCRIMCL